MKKNEFLITLCVGLILGLALLGAISLRDNQPANNHQPGSIGVGLTSDKSEPTSTLPPYQKIVLKATQSEQVEIAAPFNEKGISALLLYDDERISSFSINFCKIAFFYGLNCKQQVINNRVPLLETMLKDENGDPYNLIGLDAVLLYPQYNTISDRAINILLDSVRLDGTNLLIGKLDPTMNLNKLDKLTNSVITGIQTITDSGKDWYVSSEHPDVTLQLTGLGVISAQMISPNTFSIVVKDKTEVSTLISAKDDSGKEYPVFVVWKPSDQTTSGRIFFDSGEDGQSLDSISFRDIYYSAASFSQIIPTMLVFRSSYQDEIWHTDKSYANLTIDESVLTEPYQSINYTYLLEVMRKHNFHTTIGLIPQSWEQADPYVVALILSNEKYLSVAQYGNSGEGYEFYRYSLETVSLNNSLLIPTKSLEEQDRSIAEGLARFKMLENLTNLKPDKVMIFPGGISPEGTIKLLQKHGFLALASYQDTPLDTVRPDKWDYGMYPAVNDYSNFPILIRRMPETNTSFQPFLLPSILDLFIGKPALFSTFPYGRSMFSSGMEAFDPIADQMNGLSGDLEWHSLGYIANHIHLEKVNKDGSTSIQMFTPELIITNTDIKNHTYHVSIQLGGEQEPDVLINGYSFPHRIENSTLLFDFDLLPEKDARINIDYVASSK